MSIIFITVFQQQQQHESRKNLAEIILFFQNQTKKNLVKYSSIAV